MLQPMLILLFIVIGFASTFIASFGASGGTLGVIVIELTVKLTPSLLVGTLYVMFIVAALVAIVAYWRSGLIDFRSGLFLGLLTLPGSLIGSYIGFGVSSTQFNIGLGAIVIALAIISLRRGGDDRAGPEVASGGLGATPRSLAPSKTIVDRSGRAFSYTPRFLTMSLICACIGLMGGTYGAGPVAVMIPSMMVLGRFPSQVAIATSALILSFMNLGVLSAHIAVGAVDYYAGAALAVGAVVGRVLGAHLVFILNPRTVTTAVAVALVVSGIYLLATSFPV